MYTSICAASTFLFIALLAATFIPQQNEAAYHTFTCPHCKEEILILSKNNNAFEEGEKVFYINISYCATLLHHNIRILNSEHPGNVKINENRNFLTKSVHEK